MRKIEAQMLKAIISRKNWSQANTEVVIGFQDTAQVFLHGNHIANVEPCGFVRVNFNTLAKWPTNTTKSRLRALGCDVRTRDFVTYVDGTAVA